MAINPVAWLLTEAGLAGILEEVGAGAATCVGGNLWDVETARPPERFGFSLGYLVLDLDNVAMMKKLRWRVSSPPLGVNYSGKLPAPSKSTWLF